MQKNFRELLKKELHRIDESKTMKRDELVFEGFHLSQDHAPKAIIKGKQYSIFNSNGYLGLRFNERLRHAEEQATKQYGAGPGAVRFISGTMKVHKDLENALAKFHGREDAMIFSSAFAVNMAVMHCFIKGQSKDTLVGNDTLVISDELNHRSIIDGIRVANLPSENKKIFKHLDIEDLKGILKENAKKFRRCLVISDGIFSMLGEYQNLADMNAAIQQHQSDFEEGIISIVDDSHGVASFGKSGRGCEDYCDAKADLLIGTLGKGFGVDGGYVTGDKIFIDYLRESAATYIYSNPIGAGTAAAALEAIKILDSPEGKNLIAKLNENIFHFKEGMKKAGFIFAADSKHAIQPVLIADPVKTRALTDELFKEGIIVTNISYPIVPKGKDEIRVQISAAHTKKDLDECIEKFTKAATDLNILGN